MKFDFYFLTNISHLLLITLLVSFPFVVIVGTTSTTSCRNFDIREGRERNLKLEFISL